MTDQITFILLSACFGFIAAMCFAIGTAFLNKKTIALIASTYWKYNEDQANAIISQSTQYLIGALLLIISFFLQVVATLSSPTHLLLTYPVLSNPIIFVIISLLIIGISSYFIYVLLKKWRKPGVKEELNKN